MNDYFLNYTHRGAYIQADIDHKFAKVYRNQPGIWGWTNGNKDISINPTSDKELILHILNTSPNQKEYYFMNVGAGLFQWSDNLVHFLCENKQDNRLGKCSGR